MSRAARSLFVFGIYVVVMGLGFLAAPGPLTAMLKLPPATVGWARLVGLLALVIGSYDMVGARAESLAYMKASVYVRIGFAIGSALLVAFGQMPATLLLLGATDIAGALWTAFALRPRAAAVPAAA